MFKKYIADVWQSFEKIKEGRGKEEGAEELENAITECLNDSIHVIRYLCKYNISEYEQELRIVYEDNGECELQELPVKHARCPLMSMELPVPLEISKNVLGPIFEHPLKVAPYLGYRAIEMCPPSVDTKVFRREGICYSELKDKVCD